MTTLESVWLVQDQPVSFHHRVGIQTTQHCLSWGGCCWRIKSSQSRASHTSCEVARGWPLVAAGPVPSASFLTGQTSPRKDPDPPLPLTESKIFLQTWSLLQVCRKISLDWSWLHSPHYPQIWPCWELGTIIDDNDFKNVFLTLNWFSNVNKPFRSLTLIISGNVS